MRMKNIIPSNHSRICVRKKRKGVTHLLRMAAIDFNRIDADRDHLHTARGEFRKTLLKTPQLGVAKRSPVSPIKDQDRAIGRKQIDQWDRFTVLIRQREFRRFFANPRRLRRKRDLLQYIKDFVGEERKEKKTDSSEDGS